MPTARPFAYNPGAPISGTTQYGTLAVGVSPELDYPSGAGGVRWWNGPDEDLGYCIGTSVPAGDQPTPEGNNGTVQFWRTSGFNDNEFVTLASTITGQNFTGGTEAQTWLESNGYWTSFQSSLLVYLDSGNPSSYSGVGNTWFDLSGLNNNATLINTPTYSPSYDGILQFDNTSLETANIPDLGNLENWTIEAWVRFTTVPLSSFPYATAIITNTYSGGTQLNFSMGTNNAATSYNVNVGFFDGAWHNTTGFAPEANTWYQIVGTYDGTTLRQYVNGNASGGTLNYVGVPTSGGQTRLMRRWDATPVQGDYCDGDLAIVKIYNTAQSAADILSSYNSTFSRFIDPTPTPTPTITPTPTNNPTPTITPSSTYTLTPTPELTTTPTPSSTVAVTPTPSSTPTIVTSNLVLYYDPSNSSSYSGSGTVVNDLSGNGLSGTLSNVTFTSPAFNFNGSSSTISVADNALLEPESGDWTMEAWVNHTVIAGSSRIIFAKTNGGLAADWGYGLRTSSAGATFGEVGNGTTSLQSNTSTLSINTWYQVVAVWTNLATNTFELFINGVSQGSKAHSFTSIKNTTNPLYIGSFNNGQFSQWLNGKVGVVRLYSSALTSSQVTQNFDADKTKYGL